MARETLASTVDESEIVDLGEEINIPNYMIDENFAIIGDEFGYTLVERRISHRTGKEKDGKNEGKIIKYVEWKPTKTQIYSGTIFGIFDNYANYVNGNKFKKLKKSTNFEEVRQIYIDTQKVVREAMKSSQFTDDIKTQGTLINEITELKRKLDSINKVLQEADELRELIKTKRRIIIGETEPKKHRTPKEEE